jgi:hypothetical protein
VENKLWKPRGHKLITAFVALNVRLSSLQLSLKAILAVLSSSLVLASLTWHSQSDLQCPQRCARSPCPPPSSRPFPLSPPPPRALSPACHPPLHLPDQPRHTAAHISVTSSPPRARRRQWVLLPPTLSPSVNHPLWPYLLTMFQHTRLGRGQGSTKGGTAGRGHKGQKARSGNGKPVPGYEGGQTPIHRLFPKRGFVNLCVAPSCCSSYCPTSNPLRTLPPPQLPSSLCLNASFAR